MKLISFELLKVRKHPFFLAVFCLCISTLCISAYFFYADHQDFVSLQKQEANIMLHRIEESSQYKDEHIMKEKNLYTDMLHADTWQEVYVILNDIDQLFLDEPGIIEKNKSDLPYDYQTNIEVRKYHILHDISPDNQSSGVFMVTVFHNSLNYLFPIFIFFISVCIFSMEYEERTILYLYTLPYKYTHILLSKLFTTLCMSLFTMVLPLLVMYVIFSILYGFSNASMLIETSKQFAQVTLHQAHFLPIYHVLGYILFFILLDILVISSIVCFVSTVCKNHIAAIITTGICFGICMIKNFLIPIGNILLSSLNFQFQCAAGCMLIVFAVIGTIHKLNKKSIL